MTRPETTTNRKSTLSVRLGMTLAACAATAATALSAMTATAATPFGSDDAAFGVPQTITAGGVAFGTRVVTGNEELSSLPTAKAVMCTQESTARPANNVAGANLGPLGRVGAVQTNLSSAPVEGNRAATSTTTIASANLLEGAIKVGTLRAQAQVVAQDPAFTGQGQTSIASLTLAGEKIPTDQLDEPQMFELPGVARIWLNQTKTTTNATGTRTLATALRVRLSDGTLINVGQARAKLSNGPVGLFTGGAWGSEVNVAGAVRSGKTAVQPLPCRGTDSQVRSNRTAGIRIPDVVRLGATESTAQTKTTTLERTAVTTSTVAFAALSQLRLEGIVARAEVVGTGSEVRVSSQGTSLGALFVNGERQEIPADAQVIEIPGIATLFLNEVNETDRGIEVTAVRVVLLPTEDQADPIEVKLGNAVAALR